MGSFPKRFKVTVNIFETNTIQHLTSWWLNHPFGKNKLVKLDHFPRDRGENKKYLKPTPTSFFKLDLLLAQVSRSLRPKKGHLWVQMSSL